MNATLKQLLIKAILGESFEEELQRWLAFIMMILWYIKSTVKNTRTSDQRRICEYILWYTNTCKTAQKANQKFD